MLVAAGVGRWQLQAVEPAHESNLAIFPRSLGEWKSGPDQPFDSEILAVLRADDYVNRIYRTDSEIASLYVGYYRSQKHGTTMHSPLNCLPGAGWQPMQTERVPFGGRGAIKQVVIQKGEQRQAVLYWYQSAQRLEGDEYLSKMYLVLDAMRSRRNDAALVRITAPIDPHVPDGAEKAFAAAKRLGSLAEPELRTRLFPSLDERTSRR